MGKMEIVFINCHLNVCFVTAKPTQAQHQSRAGYVLIRMLPSWLRVQQRIWQLLSGLEKRGGIYLLELVEQNKSPE